MKPSNHNPRIRSRLPAFTLIELIMVMGIIVVLISLVIVGLRGVQRSAARTESVNALRQMVAGYIGYTMDNRDRLMPGYVDYAAANPIDLPLNARLSNGEWMASQNAPPADRQNVSSYVWRIAPYLQHDWRVLMTDYRDRGVIRHFETQFNSEIYGPFDVPPTQVDEIPTIAMCPAFGLNSIFLGGDNRHGGETAKSFSPLLSYPSANPLAKSFVARRATEVLRPTEIVVFGPAARMSPAWSHANPNSPIYFIPDQFNQPGGYPELRPPFIEKVSGEWTKAGRQWHIKQRGGIHPFRQLPGVGPFNDGAGLPITRHGGNHLPVAHFDGSTVVADLLILSTDMRHWCPFEIGELPSIDLTQWPD